MCVRVLNNSLENSKWVTKIVVARITSSGGVKINDIISEIKSNYYIEITMNGAWKAKQIAKALVEGDAIKKYNLL